jgi:hypothetical protein
MQSRRACAGEHAPVKQIHQHQVKRVNEFDGRDVLKAHFLQSTQFTHFTWCWWICLAVAWQSGSACAGEVQVCLV